jgi:hypothetical protein
VHQTHKALKVTSRFGSLPPCPRERLNHFITENNLFSVISNDAREAAVTKGPAGGTTTAAGALQIGDRVTWLAEWNYGEPSKTSRSGD